MENFKLRKKNGEIVLTRYLGNEKKVVIPENVTVIDYFAFDSLPDDPLDASLPHHDYSNVEEIVLPEGLKKIKTHFDCPALTKINIPKSTESISVRFSACKKLKTLVVPENVREIGSIVGYFDEILIQSEILTSVPHKALVLAIKGHEKSTAEILSQNPVYKQIGNFMVNTNTMTLLFRIDDMESVKNIPAGIREIGKHAFVESLAKDRKTQDPDEEADNFPEEILKDMTEAEVEIIKEEMRKSVEATQKCKWLEKIFIPSSVKKVSEEAFENCYDLKKIEFESKHDEVEISPYAFKNCPIVKLTFADSEKKARTRGIMFDRLKIIHHAIKRAVPGNYPNANDLVAKVKSEKRMAHLGLSTIYRDIEFLRVNFNAPLEYDYFEKGYYYTDKDFEIRL